MLSSEACHHIVCGEACHPRLLARHLPADRRHLRENIGQTEATRRRQCRGTLSGVERRRMKTLSRQWP